VRDGFIPARTRAASLPTSSSPIPPRANAPLEVARKNGQDRAETPGIAHTLANPAARSSSCDRFNLGSMFILSNFPRAPRSAKSGEAIAAQLRERFQREIPKPASTSSRSGRGWPGERGRLSPDGPGHGRRQLQRPQAQADDLAAKANQQPALRRPSTGFAPDPQLYATSDRTKAKTWASP